MAGVFQWIKNITYYLIFVSLLSYLIPSGKYEQYVKLFSGAVFILLVLNPLTGSLHLDSSLARVYEQIRFTQEQEEFQQKIWGIEEQQMKQIMAQYEEAVTQDVREMTQEAGFTCILAEARIEGREERENFGQVTEIVLVVSAEEKESVLTVSAGGENREENFSRDREKEKGKEEGKTVSIENVQVVIGEESEHWQKGEGTKEQKESKGTERGQAEREAVNQFRRKVAKYYGLEEEAVKIIWQDD